MKKSILKPLLFVFIGLLIFNGCQGEIEPAEIESYQIKKNFDVLAYTSEEASALAKRIFESSGEHLKSLNGKSEDSNFHIDRENVYTVRDSIGNMTHAYRVYVTEQKPNTILNLVIAERIDGSETQSFIIEYQWEPEYFIDKKDGQIDREYERTVSYYPISSLRIDENGKSSFALKSSDPCDTDTQNVNPATGAGGTYDPNNFNFRSAGTSSVGPAGAFSGSHNYGSSGGGTVEVGQGCFCDSEGLGWESKISETDKNDDCPDVTTAVPVNESEEEYPDCKSFEFQEVSSSWQAACVNNFEMGVSLYTMNNLQIYRIKIPQLTFETWTTDRFGNETSSGAAAELSAQAVDNASWATVKHFGGESGFTEYEVTRWFEDYLKDEFRNMTDGGRVQRGNPYNLTPKEFESGRSDCD